MGLPHEDMGWDAITDGSWKNHPSYHPPYYWKRKLCAFVGIHLPMRHRFDIRELFVLKKDFAGGYHHPTYKECIKRLFA